jgi:NAD/NADP transhydrogenase beta subunit
VTFLLGAASRSAVNVRFARANNMGDISGKAVSQFTAANMIGMAIGFGLSKALSITSLPQLVVCFAGLSGVNLWASYRAADMVDEIYLNN